MTAKKSHCNGERERSFITILTVWCLWTARSKVITDNFIFHDCLQLPSTLQSGCASSSVCLAWWRFCSFWSSTPDTTPELQWSRACWQIREPNWLPDFDSWKYRFRFSETLSDKENSTFCHMQCLTGNVCPKSQYSGIGTLWARELNNCFQHVSSTILNILPTSNDFRVCANWSPSPRPRCHSVHSRRFEPKV